MPNGAHNISRERMGLGFLENFTTYTWEGLEPLRMVLRGNWTRKVLVMGVT